MAQSQCLEIVRRYCQESDLHGLKYLGGPGYHWAERAIWLLVCSLSWAAAAVLVEQSWTEYSGEGAVSFDLQTDFVHWSTPFPSVSVCETSSSALLPSYEKWALANYSIKRNMVPALVAIRYFDGERLLLHSCGSASKCPFPVARVAWEKRMNCTDIFVECSWKGEVFDCCRYFHPLHTEIGICYSINNKLTTGAVLDLQSNVSSGLGSLRAVVAKAPLQVFVTSPGELPHLAVDSTNGIRLGRPSFLRLGITVTQVLSASPVRQASRVAQRRCRFPDENPLQRFSSYSYSGCVTECRLRAHLRACNCTSPLMPAVRPEQVCDVAGLLCIASQRSAGGGNRFRELLPPQPTDHAAPLDGEGEGDDREGLRCPCLLACDALDVKIVYEGPGDQHLPNNKYGFEIFLANLPTERYRRVLVMNLLDLVVTVGNAMALLLGASLMSAVQLAQHLALPLLRVLWLRLCPAPPAHTHARARRARR